MREWSADDTCNYSGEDVSCEDPVSRREIEICRHEKEIAKRELELARREIAFLRECRDMHSVNRKYQREAIATGGDGVAASSHPRLNLTAVADLLADFDGNSGNFDTWEKQVRLLKATYRLEDDHTKILVGMKLKGKVLVWFHSKPEFISVSFDALIDELKMMFCHRQNRVTTQRTFEFGGRTRRFANMSMSNMSMIMGNRVQSTLTCWTIL